MESNKYLAIDLGATSGRLIVSSNGNLDEVHRFYNYLKSDGDTLYWDVDFIYKEIIIGLKKATSKYKDIKSLAIDTWGVDYVLLDEEDKIIYPVYAYRDNRTINTVDEVHNIIPFEKLYKITGMQFNRINTIYQLKDDFNKGRLVKAKTMLYMPDYFVYKLTGKKTYEYTNVSTSGMVDILTNEYSLEIIDKLKFPKELFPNKLDRPGLIVGDLKDNIQKEIGLNIPVILCASHDTASAFSAVDLDPDSLIVSSGTWSLVGVKIPRGNTSLASLNANFTNEGAINGICYLKNIMGMWLINEVRKIHNYSYDEIDKMVASSTYNEIFDVADSSLLAPNDMIKAISDLLIIKPSNDGDVFRSIYRSLATKYLDVCKELENNLKQKFNKICIVGGGAKIKLLNEIIEEITDREVVAIPFEATAHGNIKVQQGVKL